MARFALLLALAVALTACGGMVHRHEQFTAYQAAAEAYVFDVPTPEPLFDLVTTTLYDARYVTTGPARPHDGGWLIQADALPESLFGLPALDAMAAYMEAHERLKTGRDDVDRYQVLVTPVSPGGFKVEFRYSYLEEHEDGTSERTTEADAHMLNHLINAHDEAAGATLWDKEPSGQTTHGCAKAWVAGMLWVVPGCKD